MTNPTDPDQYPRMTEEARARMRTRVQAAIDDRMEAAGRDWGAAAKAIGMNDFPAGTVRFEGATARRPNRVVRSFRWLFGLPSRVDVTYTFRIVPPRSEEQDR